MEITDRARVCFWLRALILLVMSCLPRRSQIRTSVSRRYMLEDAVAGLATVC